jgi:electron transport complex protein RnfD
VSDLYGVSSSPHICTEDTSSKIMLYVILALLPTSIFGIYNFGLRALLLIVICVTSCVASEWIFEKIAHKESTVKDLSAALTGLLLALNLPHTLPIWQAILGSVFAIVVIKIPFGGLGKNILNPALGARCVMLFVFAGTMTSLTYEGVRARDPLTLLEYGANVDTIKMFFGTTNGMIGETSVVSILIGAAILLLLGVIKLRIPMTYMASFLIFWLLFSEQRFHFQHTMAQLCGGGFMLGAFFMANDYVTSPITPMGQIVYGILLGILTGIFRLFGINIGGVSFAIILGNLFVPIIEKYTIPRAFGKKKRLKERA